ncbi:MAG: hypothetical protein ACRDOI_00970 [Trebonia sp.]
MIRIRYEDVAAGTHVVAGRYGRVERGPRWVTVYLLPGLADGQRRAVIRRLRQEASRGFGPPLPPPQLALALGIDRVRTAARIGRAIVRLHPAVTLVPGAFVVAMMTLFVVAAGNRPDIAPTTRGGLAAAAAVSGGITRAVTAVPPRGLGAWYVCPWASRAFPPRQHDGQLACRRPASRAVSQTAHLPGPLDFA